MASPESLEALRDCNLLRRIQIAGLVKDDPALKVNLVRSQSFPACRANAGREYRPPVPTWGPLPLPPNGDEIELSLHDEPISEGRVGVVYSADVTLRSNPDGLGSLPTTLCVKVIKPRFSRRAAREAWMHEQLTLSGCSGTATPRYFGFFTAPLRNTTTATRETRKTLNPDDILPWVEARFHDSDHDPYVDSDSELPPDSLNDDSPEFHKYDVGRHRRNSPWYAYEHDDENPLLSVLLFEVLGPRMFSEPDMKDREKEYHEEAAELVIDIGMTGVRHHDLRTANVLQVPSETLASPNSQICARHGRKHNWRIIDFDSAAKYSITPDDIANNSRDFRRVTTLPVEKIGGYYWWGLELSW
ncbi:protein kinase subdomain-containing protein PKL/ccin3 [Coprinopsis cinerea AmutBmut pab1-1]|nr:protein kinase subdomain-containing protein PKL/ccin3 [Coprinopsis cinerea AmutBmut pab1-1]